MRNSKPVSNVVFSAALALALAVATHPGSAEEQATAAASQPTTPTVLSAQDALKAMAGMAGNFRMTPDGQIYLYPRMKSATDMKGMFGTYRVTEQGILLYPSGMAGESMGMSAMGGASGSFRIVPSGEAYFYPHAEEPVGMSGMTGRKTQ